MKNMLKGSICGTAAAITLMTLAAHAQERAAAGTLDTQMTWSALSAKVDAANAKSDGVSVRMDQVVVCGKKGMLYAPGATGADSDGCLDASGGKGCVMDRVAVCGSTTNCQVRANVQPYKLGKSNTETSMPIWANWKDGEVNIWSYSDTTNNKGGGQCINGTMHYFDRF